MAYNMTGRYKRKTEKDKGINLRAMESGTVADLISNRV
jgi:hypothetical protein